MVADEIWRKRGVGPDPSRSGPKTDEARRYDRRPATTNLDRPMRMVTTRTSPQRSQQSNLLGLLGLAVAGVALVGFGMIVGMWLRDDSAVSQSVLESPASDEGLQRELESTATIVVSEAEPVADQVESAPAGEVLSEQATDGSSMDDASMDGSAMDDNAADGAAMDHSATPQVMGAVETSDPALGLAVGEFDVDRLSFVHGTNRLTEQGENALEELADLLSASPNEPLEIMVRTFSQATPGENHGLSVDQATALLDGLVGRGIDEQRLSAVGVGSSGAEAPLAASAIKFSADVPEQSELTVAHGPIILVDPFTGTFPPETVQFLSDLGQSLAARPDTEIALVGYAWNKQDQHHNHEESHHLLDAAFAEMQAMGASADQVSLVGLGGVGTTLSKKPTEVEIRTGPNASIIGVLSAVDPESVAFAPSTAELSPHGEETLTSLAQLISSDRTTMVEVAVHTYSQASSQANHDLSRLQADTIFGFLVDQGVAPTQLDVVWHGDPAHFASPGRTGAVTFTVVSQ